MLVKCNDPEMSVLTPSSTDYCCYHAVKTYFGCNNVATTDVLVQYLVHLTVNNVNKKKFRVDVSTVLLTVVTHTHTNMFNFI